MNLAHTFTADGKTEAIIPSAARSVEVYLPPLRNPASHGVGSAKTSKTPDPNPVYFVLFIF